MECHDHDRDRERPHRGGSHLKERRRKSLPQMLLICQPVDTRLKGDDRVALGTIKLTAKDHRRILIHVSVWDTTRDLGFPVTRNRDIVKSVRNSTDGRQTNFISPESLRLSRQVVGEWDPENEPTVYEDYEGAGRHELVTRWTGGGNGLTDQHGHTG